jgi:hypothetical protein
VSPFQGSGLRMWHNSNPFPSQDPEGFTRSSGSFRNIYQNCIAPNSKIG